MPHLLTTGFFKDEEEVDAYYDNGGCILVGSVRHVDDDGIFKCPMCGEEFAPIEEGKDFQVVPPHRSLVDKRFEE